MTEQITYYHDANNISPYCLRVEIALLEAGASYTAHGFDIYNKPEWFVQLNPMTGKIPVITYGGPKVPPEEPSPLSFKLTESCVILEFLADVYHESNLLPPVSDPIARAHVRFFVDTVLRSVEAVLPDFSQGKPGAFERLVEGLGKVQGLLPDPDAPGSGEFALGKNFTNADCAIAPLLAFIALAAQKDLGRFEPGVGKRLGEVLAGEKFNRLRRYEKAVFERESVKKAVDIDHIERVWRARFLRN